MIELVSESRCVGCGLCVKVCPMNVFDAGPDGVPVIARQEDCQTCFVCEAYCPADALYVSPLADVPERADERALAERGVLGSWRAEIGWGAGRGPNMAERDTSHILDSIHPMRGG